MADPEPETWPLGHRFMLERRRRNLSQREAGALIGLSRTAYDYIEKGRRTDSADFGTNRRNLALLAHHFGLTSDESEALGGPRLEEFLTPEELAGAPVDEAYRLLELCTPEERAAVIGVLKAILKERAQPGEEPRSGAQSEPEQ